MAHTLTRSLHRRSDAGNPLPTVFRRWESAGICPRRGQVLMLAGVPNCGKTMLALWQAIKMGEPTLYVSADSDEPTQMMRAMAAVTGATMSEVETAFAVGAQEVYRPDLAKASHINFSFDPSPTLEDIALDVESVIEMTGTPPAVLIIDTLMNIDVGGDDFGAVRQVPKACHHWARHYGCAVWLLHHCSEQPQWGPVHQCPPRAAIHGKISQLPELIVTVALTQDDHMLTCAVKNRNGPSWPRGDHPVALFARPDRMSLYEDSATYLAAGRAW